jgi:L-amino acid N-acyltransferase YncA
VALAAVRVATEADAAAMATVQLDVWRTSYAAFLPPEVVDSLDLDAATAAWAQAIGSDGDAHLLVATEGVEITGFAAGTGGEVATLLVAPRWGRRGHGGRLLGTVAHLLRQGGAQRAQVWVADADEASLRFFPRHGWHLDGTVRTSQHGAHVLRELRLTGSTDVHWR